MTVHDMYMYMSHVYVHVTCACTCHMYMYMYMYVSTCSSAYDGIRSRPRAHDTPPTRAGRRGISAGLARGSAGILYTVAHTRVRVRSLRTIV